MKTIIAFFLLSSLALASPFVYLSIEQVNTNSITALDESLVYLQNVEVSNRTEAATILSQYADEFASIPHFANVHLHQHGPEGVSVPCTLFKVFNSENPSATNWPEWLP